jgi:hypothetical protein
LYRKSGELNLDIISLGVAKKSRKITLKHNTNVPVGGIDIDTEIKVMDTNDLFEKMLIKSLAPKTKLEFYDSADEIIDSTLIRTAGVPLTIKTIKATSEKSTSSDIIVSMETYSTPSISDFDRLDYNINESENIWTFNDITIDQKATFSIKSNNNKGLIGKCNTTFNFVNCSYAGIVPSTTTISTITEAEIKSGKIILQQKGDINDSFIGNGKMFFAYESTWGNAKSIVDVLNNVNIINAFEKKEIDITNASGVVKYVVYLANVRGNYNESEVNLKF